MPIHESLQQLVAVRGATVTDDHDELRGALDDFLAEDEATTGEVNLLVDAVRLGGLRRLVELLDHGSSPSMAIRDAATALARDRGTDDLRRSAWSLAVLGYAIGRLDAAAVEAHAGTGAPATRPASSPSTGPTPYDDATAPLPPVAAGGPAGPPSVSPMTPWPAAGEPIPAPGPAPTVAPFVAPPVPPAPAAAPSRRKVWLPILVVLVLLGVAIGGAIALRLDDDEPASSDTPGPAGDDAGDADDDVDTDDWAVPPLSDDEIVAAFAVDGTNAVYRYDVETHQSDALTSGPYDRLPSLSTDRSIAVYLVAPDPSGPFEPWALDLESGQTKRLFAEDDPCGQATRPAWSPSGDRVALVCTQGEVATYVVDGESGDKTRLRGADPEPRGTPTWVSESTLVYATFGAGEGEPSEIWIDDDVDDDEPARLVTQDISGWASHPDYSPEAGRVLFSVSDGDDGFGQLWTMAPDGSDQQLLADGRFGSPIWSPDGRRICFLVEVGDTTQLAVAPAGDPTAYTVLEGLPGVPGPPVWGSR